VKVGADSPVACLPPRAAGRPGFLAPSGAWDTHAHVIGAPPHRAWVSPRNYDPPVATVDNYIDVLDVLGLTYGVLVQVSVHGTDNGCLVEALRAHPDRLRGVAAVLPDIGDAQLDSLHEAGVRGVRILSVVAGGVALASAAALARRVRRLGWHVEFGLDGPTLVAALPALLEFPVPTVIAHFGDCDVTTGTKGPQFSALARLLSDSDCYVKLSAAYRLAVRPWNEVAPMARALIELAPDRLLWGSDWPHVAIADACAMPPTQSLLDLLPDWASDSVIQRRILVENPLKLYCQASR
jgi:2-pyrone-4,6-dicarboxylate lactonase